MKELEFQHFKKAPHPFQKYGNLPPAAYNNRSISQDYSSIPQGEQGFINKVGKKQFENKHQSSIKQHWLGQTQNDSLSMQIAKHHKVKGKSLQTRDIQGAQGGSLKSPAVKYKQKAQQLKNHGKINGFDHYQLQKQQYKLKIQNAVKSQHSNDVQIGKLISWKGHGHVLNPQKKQSNNNKQNIKYTKNSQNLEKYQHSLKQKYDDFESKNQQYKQFFNKIKSQQQNYDEFFSKLKSNQFQQQKQQNKPQINQINTYQTYNSKQMPTPKITSKQYQFSISQKYKTLDLQNQKKRRENQTIKQHKNWKQQQFLKHYQPPNFPKKSLQSQFRQQHYYAGNSLNSSRINQTYQNQNDKSNSLHSSRKTSNDQKSIFEARMARKFNPTNLSHIIGSGSFNLQ